MTTVMLDECAHGVIAPIDVFGRNTEEIDELLTMGAANPTSPALAGSVICDAPIAATLENQASHRIVAFGSSIFTGTASRSRIRKSGLPGFGKNSAKTKAPKQAFVALPSNAS